MGQLFANKKQRFIVKKKKMTKSQHRTLNLNVLNISLHHFSLDSALSLLNHFVELSQSRKADSTGKGGLAECSEAVIAQSEV